MPLFFFCGNDVGHRGNTMKHTLKRFVRNTFVIIGVVLAVFIILPIVLLVWWLDRK